MLELWFARSDTRYCGKWVLVLNIHWKDWYWSSDTLTIWWEELTYWKRPWCWERLKAGGEGTTEDEMVGWHHWLNGHEFEQAPGVGYGQGSLACCSSWGCKELDMTEQLKWTELGGKMSYWSVDYITGTLFNHYIFFSTFKTAWCLGRTPFDKCSSPCPEGIFFVERCNIQLQE